MSPRSDGSGTYRASTMLLQMVLNIPVPNALRSSIRSRPVAKQAHPSGAM